jgi:hypothetical protein
VQVFEMIDEKRGLVRKILWTQNVDDLKEMSDLKKQILKSCERLEEQGLGMLADKNNPEKIDDSCSVVCSDGSIFTPKQITDYLIKRRGEFNSENPEDMKMHKINLYYSGFKE